MNRQEKEEEGYKAPNNKKKDCLPTFFFLLCVLYKDIHTGGELINLLPLT